MQLYRGMDIGTAKLTVEERAGRPAPPAGHLGRHRGRQRRRVPAAGPRRDRPAARRRAASRSWSAAPGCTCGPPSTRWSSPAPTPRSRARLEAELEHARRRARCTPGWPPSTPRPRARSCPATAAASCARWRSSRSPAGPSPPTCPATSPSTTPCRSASTCPRPELDERIAAAGRPDVGGRTGRRGARPGGGRPARRADRLARTRLPAGARRISPASAPRTRRAPRPYGPPNASPAGRIRGSAATRGCTGSTARGRGTRRAGAGVAREKKRSQPDHVMATGRSGVPDRPRRPCHHRASSYRVGRVGGRVAMAGRPTRHPTGSRPRRLGRPWPGFPGIPESRPSQDALGPWSPGTPIGRTASTVGRRGRLDGPTVIAAAAATGADGESGEPRRLEEAVLPRTAPAAAAAHLAARPDRRPGRPRLADVRLPARLRVRLTRGPVVAMLGLLLSCCAAGWGLMAARRIGYTWPGLPAARLGRPPRLALRRAATPRLPCSSPSSPCWRVARLR